MATLQKIRNKAGILVSVVIGLALLAFVLGDFLGKGNSVFSGNQMRVAEIDGKEVNIQEYQAKIDNLSDIYKFNSGQTNLDEKTVESIRDQTWQQLVDEIVLGKEYNNLGITISPEELKDMVVGAEPHAIVKQLFTNPETQELNRSAIIQFIKNLEQDQTGQRKTFWLYIENEIVREKLQSKYNSLIKKGLYVTKKQSEIDVAENAKKVNLSFVIANYNTIPDSTIKVKESELKKYLKAHEADFEQESSRDIQYVTFAVEPSNDDFNAASQWINNIKAEFEASTESKQFINLNSDTPFNDKYYKQSELADSLKALYTGKVGDTYGPYFEGGIFKIARVFDFKSLPDSVKASHILIKPKAQTKEAMDAAKKQADSLKLVITNGGKFEELAKLYSTDGSAAAGGDLGWFKEGAMVKPFNDACFNGKKGDVTVVESQFGVHVIKITDKGAETKKVQLAILERKVEPSSATYQAIYQKASAFAGLNNTAEKFDAAAKKDNLDVRTANYLQESNKQVQNLLNSRELVRWAFNAKEKEISEVKEFGNLFVVAKLNVAREKGIAKLEHVKDQVQTMVIRDKKAELLIEKIKKLKMTDINELAIKLNTNVQTATDISFKSYSLANAGVEPIVIATSIIVPQSKISEPIKGNNGVYIILVTNVNEQPTGTDVSMSQMQLNSTYQNRATYEGLSTLKKIANVKDERMKFF